MKLSLLSFAFAVLPLSPAIVAGQVVEGQELLMLNPAKLVHEVAVNESVATTINFPGKITLLTGFGLVQDSGEVDDLGQSRVALIHYDNVLADTLVVRLVKKGEPCHATIRTAEHLFLMRFVPSESANLAVIVPPPHAKDAAKPTTPVDVVTARLQFSADELVGILSKAKARKALQPLNPGLFAGWQERNGLEMSTTVNNVTCTIYEIQRWAAKDANVFRCWIVNAGDRVFEFEPNGVKVRVGERSYPAQLVDCSGIAPPGQRIPLDVVLQGNLGGGREHLSISQDFRIELPEEGKAQISAALFGDASTDNSK